MGYVYFSCMGACSLISRPEEEEEKGPGFSHLRMRLIAVEFHGLRILLTYFRQFVTHNFDTKHYTVHRFIMAAYGVQRIHLIMRI